MSSFVFLAAKNWISEKALRGDVMKSCLIWLGYVGQDTKSIKGKGLQEYPLVE